MKKLVDGDRWNDRWWMKNLDAHSALIACWLWDKVDKAGFAHVDMEDMAEEAFLSLPMAMEAYGRLCKPYKGYARLYEREGDSPGKKWIWLRNYIKVQIRGMDFKQPEQGKQVAGVLKGIATILVAKEELFPEVMAYKGYRSLLMASDAYGRQNRIEQNRIDKSKSIGESEGRRGHMTPIATEGDYAMTRSDPLYEKLLEIGIGVRWSEWVQLRKSHPDSDVDWPKIVEYVCGCHRNSEKGVDGPWRFLKNLCEKGKYMKKDLVDDGTKRKEAHAARRSEINAMWLDRKIVDKDGNDDPDECTRLHKVNDEENGK